MSTNDISVVIIDDHTLVRAGIARLIDSEPDLTVVGEASTVGQGEDMLRRTRPDVMVVDVSMPDGSGLSLVRSARRENPRLGIVVLTMHNDDETLLEALDAGASALVLRARRPTTSSTRYVVPPTSPGRVLRRRARRRHAPPADRQAPADPPRDRGADDAGGRRLGRQDRPRPLFMSESTVKTHVGKLYDKLDAHNRAEAVMAAVRLGLVKPSPEPSLR